MYAEQFVLSNGRDKTQGSTKTPQPFLIDAQFCVCAGRHWGGQRCGVDPKLHFHSLPHTFAGLGANLASGITSGFSLCSLHKVDLEHVTARRKKGGVQMRFQVSCECMAVMTR
jgi:hypothetical protein